MPTLKANLAANLFGRFWRAIIQLAALPFYLKLLGVESFGLIGFFTTLVGLLTVLDLGLSTTLNRELSRLSARDTDKPAMHDLVRTLGLFYWGIAALIGGAVFLLAPVISAHWISSNKLPIQTVNTAVNCMALVIALRWPFNLYSGGLLGLRRHVTVNLITAASMTVESFGAILVLWLISPTIEAFFLCQAAAALGQTLVTRWALIRAMPASARGGRIEMGLLSKIWRFATGMSGVGVVGTLLTFGDKLVLSSVLDLKSFGYYSVAAMVAQALFHLIHPVFVSVFPEFTRLVERKETERLKELFHTAAQLIVIGTVPAASVLIFFSPEVLLLWTRDPVVVAQAWLLVSILVAGTCLNGLNNVPYALQLAHGWTSLVFWANVVALIFLIPLTVVLARTHGAVGGAVAWLLLNMGYVLILPHLIHRRLLVTEKWRWYLRDVLLASMAPVAVAAGLRMAFPSVDSKVGALLLVGTTALLSLGAAFISAPRARRLILSWRHRDVE